MQIRKPLLFAVAALVFVLSSCSKTNKQGRLVPQKAAIVVQVNGKSLSEKLPWDEIKQNPLFKEAYADSTMPSSIKKLLDNPENAGIDTKSDLIFFGMKDSIGGYIAFEGTIKDVAAFKKFNEETAKGASVSEKDGISYITQQPICASWNKEHFIYVFDAPFLAGFDKYSGGMSNMDDSVGVNGNPKRDIAATCKSLFDLKEDASLGKNEKFTKLMKEDGDLHFWMNSEELYKGGMSNPALVMFNLEKLYKDNITTATINFDNGKIRADMRSYANEELTKLYKKYSGGKIDESLLKRIPGKEVNGAIAIKFKPEALQELLKLTNVDGLLNMGLAFLGFTMDDFVKANKGDVLIALSDLSMNPDSIISKPDYNFIFSASINDKDAFNKLVNAGKKAGDLKASDSTKPSVFYNSANNLFAMSNTKENVEQYLSGSKTTDRDFISRISGQPFGGYFNLQSIMKAAAVKADNDSSARAVLDVSLKFWNDVAYKGGDIDDGSITQSVEVTLVDKNTNSLKQINQYASKLSAIYLEMQKKREAEVNAIFDKATEPEVVKQGK